MDPYIGITDFMSARQVTEMLAVFNRHKRAGSRRRLMVGVMMSRKTLNGQPTKWANAFPPKESIADIFCSDESYNCLHYADYKHDPHFWRNLAEALSYGGMGIHSVQLDMIWPSPDDILRGIETSRKPVEVILQINSSALDQVDNNPKALLRKLQDYKGATHRVLLDKSIGRGRAMNEQVLRPFVEELYSHMPDLGIAVAGGLGPHSMYLVQGLASDFPCLSIDAQGQLRSSGDALDPIDWEMAAEYLRQALKIFN